MPLLLVCTLGGEPRPVAFSIAAAQPDRIFFIGSSVTQKLIDNSSPEGETATVTALLREKGYSLSPGMYDWIVLRDPQDLNACIAEIRDRMDAEVARWCARGGGYHVAVDFTGGTKVMTAALTLVSRRWPCEFRYVGGSVRTNHGVGRVETGSEMLIRSINPWNSLGYEAVETAAKLADSGSLRAASLVLKDFRDRTTTQNLKRSLQTFKSFIDGLSEWDVFRHSDALRLLKEAEKNGNDLRAFFNDVHFRVLIRQLEESIFRLEKLCQTRTDYGALTLDLLANADRRMNEGRWDDAAARCYRAVEAIAQARLGEQYGIQKTKSVPAEAVPEALREEWSGRIREGYLMLGLQDDYALLAALGDVLADRFRSLGLNSDDKKSPLQVRNNSICAHGDTPVPEASVRQLFAAAVALAGVNRESFPEFPRFAPAPEWLEMPAG
jgi:CRISPR-associated protein (TIGR02710 family)